MSTKEFQSHDDALSNYLDACERLKTARAEFVKHIRQTGIQMRKQLILSPNKFISINCVLSDSRAQRVSMTVTVTASEPLHPDDTYIVQDWLRKHHWKVQQQDTAGNSPRWPHQLTFVCI